MVGAITLQRASRRSPGSTVPEEAVSEVAAVHRSAGELSSRFRGLEEADQAAFESYLEASRMPRSSESENTARAAARGRAARVATEVPLEMLEAARDVVALGVRLLRVSETISLRAESDLFGAMELARAAFRAAELNVRVNWPSLASSDTGALRPRWDDVARSFGDAWDVVEEARPRFLPDPR
jgi:formiminotetrahydrofolate cyclodeaminase